MVSPFLFVILVASVGFVLQRTADETKWNAMKRYEKENPRLTRRPTPLPRLTHRALAFGGRRFRLESVGQPEMVMRSWRIAFGLVTSTMLIVPPTGRARAQAADQAASVTTAPATAPSTVSLANGQVVIVPPPGWTQ